MTNPINNFKTIFSSRLSKSQIEEVSIVVYHSDELFNEMIDVILNGKNHEAFMASWALGYAGIKRSDWFYARLPEIFERLEKPAHESVIRNTLRVIWKTKIPKNMEGLITQKCIEWLENKESSIATHAFSIHIMAKIIEHEPELCNEIRDIVESILPYASSGVINSGEKLLKKIRKMGY